MAKIYLSSTFKDLAEHRQAVYRVLRQLGHDVVSMEDYTATGRPPMEKCLADVRGCETYVGIFAWRYGFVPPGEAKAITELEYREAVAGGKTTLIFLLDEAAPWSPSLIDRDRTAIEELRGELQLNHVVQFFASPQDLATGVSVAVARLGAEKKARTAEATEDPSAPRFYLKCLSRITDELDSEIRIYRTSSAALIGVGLVTAVAGWAMGPGFVGLGGVVIFAVTVFPANVLRSARHRKALLEGYEEGLRQDPPVADAVSAVKAFLDRQLKGESLA